MTTLEVPSFVLRQHDTDLYMFTINSKDLLDIVYVLPRSRDNPTEIQRGLDQTRIGKIGYYIRSRKDTFFPNSIVLNLSSEVKFEPVKNKNFGKIIFPSSKGKFGYILDGQHRLYGFQHSEGVHFDLPIVAFIDIDRKTAYKVFADINSLQTKVNDVLLQLLRFEIADLDPDRERAVQIVHRLNTHSVLKSRIREYPEDKGTWIKAPTLSRFIKQIIGPGGPLQGLDVERQVQILTNYFQAMKQEYPAAWGSEGYLLCKSMGIEIACNLFKNVYARVKNYEKGSTKPEAFRKQLQYMGKIKIGDEEMEFDWSSEHFGKLSSGQGRRILNNAVLAALPPEDPHLKV